jgi:hypothetical protein
LIGSIKKEGHLDHNHTVLEKSLISHLTGLVVNEVDVCTRLIDPADEEVAPEHILIVVILEIGFGIQVGCKGIDDPGGSDVCAELAALRRQIKIVIVIDKFDVEMLGEFDEAAGVYAVEITIVELTEVGCGTDGYFFAPVRMKEPG